MKKYIKAIILFLSLCDIKFWKNDPEEYYSAGLCAKTAWEATKEIWLV